MEPLTPEECDQIDPQSVDSVTADRLLYTIRLLREDRETLSWGYSDFAVTKAAAWLAREQGEEEWLARWLANSAEDWIYDEVVLDPWAHDWRAFMALYLSDIAGFEQHRLCSLCGHPSAIRSKNWGACCDRHRNAILGKLADEQCRLCNEVRPCAFDLAGSPVCADCHPGEQLLADRRAEWAARWTESKYGGD